MELKVNTWYKSVRTDWLGTRVDYYYIKNTTDYGENYVLYNQVSFRDIADDVHTYIAQISNKESLSHYGKLKLKKCSVKEVKEIKEILEYKLTFLFS